MTDNLQLTHTPISKAEMLIRKPVGEVFNAFIDPNVTTHFWFTKSSGKLEPGKQVTWTWEMYGAVGQVTVKEIVKDRRIVIEWPSYGSRNTVEWLFTPYGSDATYVSITESGFQGDGDKVVANALDSKGAFAWVLAGLKAYLEHGIDLNLIGDAYPKGLKEH